MNLKIIGYGLLGLAIGTLSAAGVSLAATTMQAATSSAVASSTLGTLPGDNKPPAAIAMWCVDYSENLGVGSRGNDVIALQKELTADGESVSSTGYFGKLTAAAVTAFQEKYASDVLTPLGLSSGTGYFGSSTRTMLNAVGVTHCTVSGGSSSTSSSTESTSTAPIISGIAPTSSPIGGLVTITGTGFAATDTVLIDGMIGGGATVTSTNGKTISFTVPGSLRPNCAATMICAMYIVSIQSGDHAVSVVVNGLTSNTTTLAVTGGTTSL